ncbi:MAG: histone-fold-containing protein [Benjaminiella poitrasii]|nr:MAG: histone-fold-containing protein [Benjaminiella poitrasii]
MTSQQHIHEETQQHHVQPPLPPPHHHQAYHHHHQQQQQMNAASAAQPMFDLGKFWVEEMHEAEHYSSDFKNHALPLARIKKVMKTDQEVKAPILFAKGCEIFITELTKRAWVHAEENKRRTLQRSDIATAIAKTDMCDFLIDIVPREEAQKTNHAIYDQATTYTGANNQPVIDPTSAAAAAAAAYYQPQYTAAAATEQMNTQAYYPTTLPPQFTNDPVQQYQMHLQQFAQQQQPNQQSQQQPQQQQSPAQQQVNIKYEAEQPETNQEQQS